MPDRACHEAKIQELSTRVRELEAEERVDPATLSIAENSPSTILLLDRDCRIQYINHTEPALSPEAVKGHTVYEYVGEEFHETMRATYGRVAATRKPDRYETSYVTQRGRTSWWESTIGAVVRAGEFVGFSVVSTNVTLQRCRTASEERFFNLSIDMLCVAGFDGYFKRLNPAFQAALGYDEELYRRPFTDFIHPDDVERTIAVVQRLISGSRVIDFENRYRRSDGTYRLLSWRGMADEATQSIYAVAQDVTRTKSLEAQLRQAQKMDAVGKLAGGVAHDFNNLLMAIQGNVELAIHSPGDRDALQLALEATQRASALTQQLLMFSRRQAIKPICLDFASLVRRLVGMLTRLIPETVEVSLTGDDSLHAVVGDISQLEQVVVNLCVNARDAMPLGGELKLQVDRVVLASPRYRGRSKPGFPELAEYVVLTVTDNGCGMGEEVVQHAFEPFYTTRKTNEGTGLGLATTYGIVDSHGGFVEVESELGVGTTFKVYLPASEEQPEEQPEPRALPEAIGSETILVAEDEPAVRNVVRRILEQAGYEVLEASHGDEALQIFREQPDRISLVLMDVVMPRMNGPRAAELIRELRSDVKVLFTSGHIDNPIDAEHLAREVCITKPYRRRELLQRIRSLLEESSA